MRRLLLNTLTLLSVVALLAVVGLVFTGHEFFYDLTGDRGVHIESGDGIDQDASQFWIPVWWLIGATSLLPVWRWLRWVVLDEALTDLREAFRRKRRRDGRCPDCGYDLRASPERCPECGAVLVQTATRRLGRVEGGR